MPVIAAVNGSVVGGGIGLALAADYCIAAESASFTTAYFRLGLTPVRLAWFGVAGVAVGLLPAWARRLYGLPGLPTTGPAAALSARTLRLALWALPERVLNGPIYKGAVARAAAAGYTF